MSQFAQKIDFGGETAGISPTIDKNAISHDWAAMGSGKFAAEGYAKAAYQRQIIFRDAGNLGHVPTLMVAQPSLRCYTASNPARSAADWRTYFFFGGPGGKLGVC